MAGHSKWANIQHRKGRQDEKRQRIWTRVMREIMVAARLGGLRRFTRARGRHPWIDFVYVGFWRARAETRGVGAS